MAGKIPREFIDDLIARIDLVDLVDARVPLKKAGSNFTARCPFHTEKSPSFTVNREKQFYHCFGCGAHGNAISFLIDYDRMSFIEAIETIAGSLGVEVPKNDQPDNQLESLHGTRELYQLQDQAAQFYARQLRDNPDAARAVDYLKKRGVSGEIASFYQIGYAGAGWRNLPDTMPEETLIAVGLAIANDKNGHHDRFRNRIMFPIRDRRGRVTGFGGRVLDDSQPKYLNSPETPIFKKHKEVYGLFELLQRHRKPERILVVEGYMDVVALAQYGIDYAVATLGTATSTDQAKLLLRYTDELVFCFDGDSAGQNAAWKAMDAALPAIEDGKSIYFLSLPSEHDPDSLIRDEGAESFETRLSQSKPLSDYFFHQLIGGIDLKTTEGRAKLIQTSKPLLAKLPTGVFRELMQNRLFKLAGQESHRFVNASIKQANLKTGQSNQNRIRPSPLRTILALLIQYPQFGQLITNEEKSRLKNSAKAGELARQILELLESKPDVSTGRVMEFFRGREEEKQVRILSVSNMMVSGDDAKEVFLDAIQQFNKQCASERLEYLLSLEPVPGLNSQQRAEVTQLLSEK